VIGQGYVIVNPLQLAVMTSCIASGKRVRPRLIAGEGPTPTGFDYDSTHFDIVRQAMSEVVNGNGTAGRSRLPFDDIMMGGKTGTAQVRRISSAGRGGAGVARRYRDHGLFVFFAPVDKPRYAGAVVIEHGIGGSRSAAPVASDVLTYLFDPQKGLEKLHALEQGWGGTAQERLEAKYRSFAAQYGATAPKVDAMATEQAQDTTESQTAVEQPQNPAPEQDGPADARGTAPQRSVAEPGAAPSPTPEPATSPTPRNPI
jgi:penicillin-binding protein 2